MAVETKVRSIGPTWDLRSKSAAPLPSRGLIALLLGLATLAVEGLIAARIIVTVLGFEDGLAATVLSWSAPLVEPFLGDASRNAVNQFSFEPEAMIALSFYGAVGFVSVMLVVLSGLLRQVLNFAFSPSVKTPSSHLVPPPHGFSTRGQRR